MKNSHFFTSVRQSSTALQKIENNMKVPIFDTSSFKLWPYDLCSYTDLWLSSSVIPHRRSTSCMLMKCFLPCARSSGKTKRVRTSLSPCMSRNVEEMNTRVFLQLEIKGLRTESLYVECLQNRKALLILRWLKFHKIIPKDSFIKKCQNTIWISHFGNYFLHKNNLMQMLCYNELADLVHKNNYIYSNG